MAGFEPPEIAGEHTGGLRRYHAGAVTWARRQYRDHKVWILLGEDGKPLQDDRGLVPMRYRPDDDRTYTIRPTGIRPLGAPHATVDKTPGPVEIWLGATPAGPEAGMGIVLRWQDHYREIGRVVAGPAATAPWLAAVLEALRVLRRDDLEVVLHLPGAEDLASLLTASTEASRTGILERAARAVKNRGRVRFEEAGDAGEARRAATLAHEARDQAGEPAPRGA
jgi:hypothetical protein